MSRATRLLRCHMRGKMPRPLTHWPILYSLVYVAANGIVLDEVTHVDIRRKR